MPPSVSLRSPPTPKWGWARKRWIPPSVSLRSPPTPQVGVGKKNVDAPFRLAPLATHPLSGGGQEKHGGKEELTQTLVSPAEL